MFFKNNTATHTDQDANHSPKTCTIRFNYSLFVVVLLSSAGVLPISAFASDTDTKAQKSKQELINAYILKKEQSNTKASGSTASEKSKADYDKLANSVKALSQALKRESEKAGIDNSVVFGKTESNSKEAAQLAKSGVYDQAHEILNNSYQMLTAEIVKLKDINGQSGQAAHTDTTIAVKSEASSTDSREYVEHALKTNAALLNALERQNKDKAGGKESEIDAIKATATEANTALEKGDIARAKVLIYEANSRIKTVIASLQTIPDVKSGNATVDAASHSKNGTAAEEYTQAKYAKRKETVSALLDAGKRIDSERGTSHTAFAKAESMINEADKLVMEGKLTEGKAQLDQAYLLIQNETRNMLSRKKSTK